MSVKNQFVSLTAAEIKSHITQILYLGRKQGNITQKDIAEVIGTSQSNYSKMERGILTPSAEEWALFCLRLHLPLDALFKGYLDHQHQAQLNYNKALGAIKVANKYRKNSLFKSRYLIPLFRFCQTVWTPNEVHNILEDRFSVDPVVFANMDAQLNYQFMLDIVDLIQKEKKIDILTAPLIQGDSFFSSSTHGDLHFKYRDELNPLLLCKLFTQHFGKYSCESTVQYQQIGNNHAQVIRQPQKFLMEYNKSSAEAIHKKLLCQYFADYLFHMAQYGGSHATIKKTSCVQTGDSACTYEITTV